MKKKERGFTLIELMIVVAIIGILAAIAIPAFIEYMNKGKKTEANLQLRSIETKVKSFRIEKGRFPVSSTSALPGTATSACIYTKINQAAWEAQTAWLEMGFHVDEDSRYQYSWADGTSGVASAVGDLDCDGTKTTQTLTLTLDNGNLSASYADPTPD